MPTLIRLIAVLMFLGGLVFAGMFVLSATVDPGEREIRVRIPSRDLMMTSEDGDPIEPARPAARADGHRPRRRCLSTRRPKRPTRRQRTVRHAGVE